MAVVSKRLEGSFELNSAQTPLVDLLRRVHPEATAEITEPGGWNYHTVGLGRTMHEAAARIEELEKRLREPVNTDLPAIQHILSRDQRDGIVRAMDYLRVFEAAAEDSEQPSLASRVHYAIDGLRNLIGD